MDKPKLQLYMTRSIIGGTREEYISSLGSWVLSSRTWFATTYYRGDIHFHILARNDYNITREQLDTARDDLIRGQNTALNVFSELIPSELVQIIIHYVPQPRVTNAQEISINERYPLMQHKYAKIKHIGVFAYIYVYRVRVAGKWYRCISRPINSKNKFDDDQYSLGCLLWYYQDGDKIESFDMPQSYVIESYIRAQYPEWFLTSQ